MAGIVFGCIVPHPPIVIPEIRDKRTAEVASTHKAMVTVSERLRDANPEVIVIISPHGEARSDTMGVVVAPMTIGSFLPWGIQGLDYMFKNDLGFVEILQEEASKLGVPLSTLGERGYNLDHGVLVPMYFLADAARDAALVPLTFSWLAYSQHFAFGQAIQSAAIRSGKRVAVVASGDLSHRLFLGAPDGFDPMGKEFDRRLVEAVRANDVPSILGMDSALIEHAGECGYRSVVILMGALDSLEVESQVLSYEGPFGVGYLVATYEIKAEVSKKTSQIKDIVANINPLVMLARTSVENFVRTGTVMASPELLTEEMKRQAGVFVSIKDKLGNLRGCIGTFLPTRTNVADEIIVNAVSSATRDPRFYPVLERELSSLVYSVDVLGEPEPIGSINDLDPKRFGVIVQKGLKRGLLLPDLEGIDSPHEQVRIAKMKAGILEFEQVELLRFEVLRYTE